MPVGQRNFAASTAAIDVVNKQLTATLDASRKLATAGIGADRIAASLGASSALANATLGSRINEAFGASLGASAVMKQSAGLAGIGGHLGFPKIGGLSFDGVASALAENAKLAERAGLAVAGPRLGEITKPVGIMSALNDSMQRLCGLGISPELDRVLDQHRKAGGGFGLSVLCELHHHRAFARESQVAHVERWARRAQPKLWIGRRAGRGGGLWFVATLQRRGYAVSHPFDDALQWEDDVPSESVAPSAAGNPRPRSHDPCDDEGARRCTLRTRIAPPPVCRGGRHRWPNSCTSSNTRGRRCLLQSRRSSRSLLGCASSCGRSACFSAAATGSAGNSANF
jgi:hypothetical protein